MSTDPADPAADLDPIPGEALPWEAAYEPLPGLLADFLDFTCVSDSESLALAYCHVANAAKNPRERPDECMVVCACIALTETAEAMQKEVKALLASRGPAVALAADGSHTTRAASLCVRLVALANAAAQS